MISNKIAKGDDVAEFHGNKLISKVGKMFCVYEDGGHYSQTSGDVIKKGKVCRDADNRPCKFESVQAAIKWIDDGMIIFPSPNDKKD